MPVTAAIYVGKPDDWTEVPWTTFTWIDSAGRINDTLNFITPGNINIPEPGYSRLIMSDGSRSIDYQFVIRSLREKELYKYNEYQFTSNRVVNTGNALAVIRLTLQAQLSLLIPSIYTVASPISLTERYSLPIQIARLAGEAAGAPGSHLLSRTMFDYLILQITEAQLTWAQFREIIEDSGFEVYFNPLLSRLFNITWPTLFDPFEWQADGYFNLPSLPWLTKEKIVSDYSRREGPWNEFYGISSIETTDSAGVISRLSGSNAPAGYTVDRIHDTRFVKILSEEFGSWPLREIAIRKELATKRARTLQYELTVLPNLALQPRSVYQVDSRQVRIETVTRSITGGNYTTKVKAWDLRGND